MNTIPTDEEVQRAKREEILRDEIRIAIQAKRDGHLRPMNLWDRLNSNFVLWLLSAVVVSGGGAIYSQWYQTKQEDQKKAELSSLELQRKNEVAADERRKRLESRSRASLEISHRYSTAMTRLREIHERHQDKVDTSVQNEIRVGLSPLYGKPDANFSPLYPEFQSHSGIAVIGEMRRHAEPGEASKLKDIIAATSGVLTKAFHTWGDKKFNALEVASALAAAMFNPDWDNGFPYTDCRAEKPFC